MTEMTVLAKTARVSAVALIVLGLTVSSYLLFRTFWLGIEGDGAKDMCSAMFGASCDATLRSPLAHQLGISLAGWGVVWYCSLAALLAIGWWLGPAFATEASLAAGMLAIPTALISALLAAAMLLGYAPLCPLCMVVHSVNFALPVVLLWCARPARQWPGRLAAAIRFSIGHDSPDPTSGKWKAIGFLASALAALALYQAVMIQESLQRDRAEGVSLPLATLLEYERAVVHDIPIDRSPQTGDAASKVTLVIFSDFRCPSCRRLAKTLAELQRQFGAKLTIVFKHFPIEAACNPAVKSDLHLGACQMAAASEAANRQGRFWPMHDLLFQTSRLPGDDQLNSMAKALGLDVRAFGIDRQSDISKSRIAADVALGQELGVIGTPTVFLNGRRLNTLRSETLSALTALEIERPLD